MILNKLDKLEQTGNIEQYNQIFDRLMMQITDILLKVQKHFYLKGLNKELHQFVESNKDNLDDIRILKNVCMRQDYIMNPQSSLTSKAKKSRMETSAFNTSNIVNKQMNSKTSSRHNNQKDMICDYCKKGGHLQRFCTE